MPPELTLLQVTRLRLCDESDQRCGKKGVMRKASAAASVVALVLVGTAWGHTAASRSASCGVRSAATTSDWTLVALDPGSGRVVARLNKPSVAFRSSESSGAVVVVAPSSGRVIAVLNRLGC
jgi:hypothetical protein